MASLRNLAISLPRLDGHANTAADRRHARGPQRTLKLLQAASDDFAGSLVLHVGQFQLQRFCKFHDPPRPRRSRTSAGSSDTPDRAASVSRIRRAVCLSAGASSSAQ
jgi:hypothetical protein